MDPNASPWMGIRTLNATTNFWGSHLKSSRRPPITGTHTNHIASWKDKETAPDSYLTTGERMRETYHSLLQYDENEDQWHFSKLLGAGGFGVAALYERRYENTVIDELVVKTEMPLQENFVHPSRGDISKEIWHLTQLNDRPEANGHQRHGVVQARGFRYLHGHTSTNADGTPFVPRPPRHVVAPFYREWRTFMEYCSFGTLSRIALTYKAWGYHIPEAFIWWTFYWLIEACKAMEPDAQHNFLTEDFSPYVRPWEGSFMLHNDIKDGNCFVGRPRPSLSPGAPYDKYPVVAMGDFGLSRVVVFDQPSQRDKIPPGTRIWMPPERRKVELGFGASGMPAYPFYNQQRVDRQEWENTRGTPQDTKSHFIGPEANVWGVGMIIYLLMTFKSMREIDEEIKTKLGPGNPSRDYGNTSQYLFDVNGFKTSLSPDEDYSDKLKLLVRECTRIEPLQRPSCDTLLEYISKALDEERERLEEEFGDEDTIREVTRMAFTNEEWHDVPQGPFKMMPELTPGKVEDPEIRVAWGKWYHDVSLWCDPEAPKLIPPMQYRIQPPGPPNQRRAWLNGDHVMYVDQDFIAGYYRGAPLPRGGRARGYLHEDVDDEDEE